jgi:glycosyltransferase involved in cell wall biosynthesis
MPYNPVLAIVIPVYNEEASLRTLLGDWHKVFRSTGVAYTFILIDDGSKDNSLNLLKTLKKNDPTLDVHTQSNAGHGPAILKGYRLALSAEWVFQIDSDHQLDTAAFGELWDNREQYDLLLAERGEKNATAGRNRISGISRLFVRLLYGSRVKDVNSPYRLMRADQLGQALEKVPDDSFAPNILITSWFVLKKKRIFTGRVEVRKEGILRQSKVSGYIFRGALRSAIQTMLFRIRS